jgi:hypothetical protein
VIALLEQVTRLTMLAMNLARVLTRQTLHESPHWQICNLHSEVNRVFRPVERVHAGSTANHHCRQQLLEGGVVARIGENRLPCVPALNDVVQPAWDMQSGSA